MYTTEQNKRLIEKYPYLMPINLWTLEPVKDYEFDYIRGDHELPDGFMRCFLLYCKAIRPGLIEADFIDKFKFSQIKEKYNRLVMYNCGYPEAIDDFEGIYSRLSYHICQICGKSATVESQGWLASYCDDCIKQFRDQERWEPIEPDFTLRYQRYNKETDKFDNFEVDCLPAWEEYLKCVEMSDEEFVNYLLED